MCVSKVIDNMDQPLPSLYQSLEDLFAFTLYAEMLE